MEVPQSTVFLSYRRPFNFSTARAIFIDLHQHGYDVFMDTESINNERFETITLAQIASRAHFLVVLTPNTLEGCQDPDDWLRREIEYAIELRRNIVPILVDDFCFDDAARTYLTGKLCDLTRYNGLMLPQDCFDQAMERLRTRFLKMPVQGHIMPAPPQDANEVETKVVQVFLCHASEDKTEVLNIYNRLKASGYKPWIDKKDLIPGQWWKQEIPKAIRASDIVLIFLSKTSVAKRGYVQQEFQLAWDVLQEQPKGTIHTIPVRLDECTIPQQFGDLHWCNLFEPDGFDNLLRALETKRSSL